MEIDCKDCREPFTVDVTLDARGRPLGRARMPSRCDSCRRARNAARLATWRGAHPDQVQASQTRSNTKRLADPDHRREKRERELHRVYGLTPEAMAELEAKQDGRCAICHRLPPPDDEAERRPRGLASIRLHVDHNHETGQVRGLLCGRCNTMLGLSGEDPAVLIAAAAYLAT